MTAKERTNLLKKMKSHCKWSSLDLVLRGNLIFALVHPRLSGFICRFFLNRPRLPGIFGKTRQICRVFSSMVRYGPLINPKNFRLPQAPKIDVFFNAESGFSY